MFGRFCYFNFNGRIILLVVERGNNANHYLNNFRNIYSSGDQRFGLSECGKRSYNGNG